MKLGIYVISVKSAAQRRESVSRQLNAADVSWKFIDAIDTNDESAIDAAKSSCASIRWHKSLVVAECACYLSHIKAWNEMLADGVDFGLILEDDFFVQADLSDILGCLLQVKSEYDMIKLYGIPKISKTIEQVSHGSLSIEIRKAFSVTGISVAQWIRSSALPRLIEKSKLMQRPVDMDLKHHWEYPLKIRHALPVLINEISANLGGSSILNRKTPKNIISIFYQISWKLQYYWNCFIHYFLR